MNTTHTMDTTPPPAPLAAAVTLLDQAARECAARGNTATSALDDLTIWHLDARLVRLTAETLRSASPDELPEPGDVPLPSGGDPLELVRGAQGALENVPDDLDNVPLFLARLRMSDALAAIRTHYE